VKKDKLYIEPIPFALLRIGLIPILLLLLYIPIYFDTAKIDGYNYALTVSSSMFEYALMSLTILIGGVLLIDTTIKEVKENNKR